MFYSFLVTTCSTWDSDVYCGTDFLKASASQAVESQDFTEYNLTRSFSEKILWIWAYLPLNPISCSCLPTFFSFSIWLAALSTRKCWWRTWFLPQTLPEQDSSTLTHRFLPHTQIHNITNYWNPKYRKSRPLFAKMSSSEPRGVNRCSVENRFHDFICIENDNWTFLYTVYRKTPYAHFHKQHHDMGQRLGRCENEDTVCSVWSEKHFLHFLLLGCREVLLSRNILWIISVVYVYNFKYFGSHVFKSRNKWAYFYIKFSFI